MSYVAVTRLKQSNVVIHVVIRWRLQPRMRTTTGTCLTMTSLHVSLNTADIYTTPLVDTDAADIEASCYVKVDADNATSAVFIDNVRPSQDRN